MSDGFKVYACSPELYKDGLIDLPYAVNAVQKKQSFSEPDFMEDAYLYGVPDKGLRLLTCFHPVPYDLSVTGDFAKRPGMYLNHAIVGDFRDIYPFETFHDPQIWTAQEKDEAYYYEQEPAELPPRKLSVRDRGQMFSEVGAFIRDGRREALKKAVSFLLRQSACPPEERKYLVIKEETQKNVEMWIAAMELAFSPRIAGGISFATRMDKYMVSNVYYVDDSGAFSLQQQSGPGNHTRLRAMVVGTVAKDKANGVRRLEDAPYLVLDGEKKEALFEEEASGEYYELISSFDEMHERFSREFLQSVDLEQPSGEKLETLAETFQILYEDAPVSSQRYRAALDSLSSYRLYKTDILRRLYQKVNERADRLSRESLAEALPILNWIGGISAFMGDDSAKERISGILSGRAEELFFTAYEKGGFGDLWNRVKEGSFAEDIRKLLADEDKLDRYSGVIRSYAPEDAVSFVEIYCALLGDRVKAGEESAKRMLARCAAAYAGQGLKDLFGGICVPLKRICGKEVYQILFGCIKTYEPELLIALADFPAGCDKAGKMDLEETLALCQALQGCGLVVEGTAVLGRYIEKAGAADLELFAKKAGRLECLGDHEKRKLYELLDGKVDVTRTELEGLAASVQKNRPGSAVCVNSAHLVALGRLQDMEEGESAAKCLKPYVKQGFPSVSKSKYVARFTSAFLKQKMDRNSQLYILELLSAAPEIYRKTYMELLVANAESCQEKWEGAVAFSAERPQEEIGSSMEQALSRALAESGRKKKSMDALGKLLRDKAVRNYYGRLVDGASGAEKKGGSILSRLFGGSGK